ncbi:uncharacterized protein F4822DRAFT_429091 [Hypoxylon trugodes]|uniref:uncharacterized protein n=1 Tax=Hypoxylon trugodes TaxID=326681 RepID=UPI002191E6E2|nr:uncharacterized protein F4822DRAFT_429091 [Hypoxylon trugodes]KAI1388467.1 hypothetical protein F4822DRAFT_429091 [Hypoxylon trugodes]
MAPDSTQNNDRSAAAAATITATATTTTTQHYTMKTSTRPPLVSSHSHHSHHSRHSQANMQSFRSNRSTTPLASPRMPHSVGQTYPPSTKLSPVITDMRSPSPNYFGLNLDHSNADIRDSAVAPLDHWSPPSSSVKSFGAAIPKQVPLDANPEFEAFRRQVDANRSKGFNLGSAHFAPVHSPLSTRPRPPRLPTNQSDSASDLSSTRSLNGRSFDSAPSRMDIDADSLHDSAYVSSDSKRNSEVSLNPPSFSSMSRFESPVHADSPFEPLRRTTLSKNEDRHPRLSLPQEKLEASLEPMKARAETLPTTLESGGPGLIPSTQLRDMLTYMPDNEFLLLDIRVNTHYAQSRIRGALNLCIPTTLLKRATFNLDKLQQTLQTEEDQHKFEQWPSVKYLIIYDGSSTEKRDAVSAMNMFKKFSNEGFTGKSYLLRGGFHTFSTEYPTFIDRQSASERPGTSITSPNGGRPSFAPVIGGVMLPSNANNPNPFFGNIRQNMDLADGVGQMDISLPSNLDSSTLPRWLQDVTKSSDHGKKASEKFLRIERSEQSRMKDAYASFNTSVPPSEMPGRVRLSGVEKGGKNRYKDILPFEHARVHLADRPEGVCDYINASHVQASRSNKRYIASQGPLPATFDDFWSVIWDQDVRVIVMLTAESEGGQLKCHSYWQSKEFGSIRLKPLSEKKVSLDIDKHRPTPGTASSAHNAAESGRRRANTTTTFEAAQNIQPPQSQPETPYVIVRKFALSHSAHPFSPIREITQLQYALWPDFGAPAQPSHLLALVELANVMQRAALPIDANSIAASVATENPAAMGWYDEPESDANARPMLVHCSAGCGRTGTFCTVDSVIDMLKRQRLSAINRSDADGDVCMKDCSPVRHRSTATNGGVKSKPMANGHKELQTDWLENAGLDLVEMTVEDFRRQRLSMVQSLRQFVLCYETVVEWVWRLQEKNISMTGGRGRPRSEILDFRK